MSRNPSMSPELRKLAGLAIGTRWYSEHRGMELHFERLTVGTEQDTDFLSLETLPSGGYSGEGLMADIKSGMLKPESPGADRAVQFVRGLDDE